MRLARIGENPGVAHVFADEAFGVKALDALFVGIVVSDHVKVNAFHVLHGARRGMYFVMLLKIFDHVIHAVKDLADALHDLGGSVVVYITYVVRVLGMLAVRIFAVTCTTRSAATRMLVGFTLHIEGLGIESECRDVRCVWGCVGAHSDNGVVTVTNGNFPFVNLIPAPIDRIELSDDETRKMVASHDCFRRKGGITQFSVGFGKGHERQIGI